MDSLYGADGSSNPKVRPCDAGPSIPEVRYAQIITDAYGAISGLLSVISNDEMRYGEILRKKLRLGLRKLALESLSNPTGTPVNEGLERLRRELIEDKFRLDAVALALDLEGEALERAIEDLEKSVRLRDEFVLPPSTSQLSGDELFKLHATLLRLYPSLPLDRLLEPDGSFTGVAQKSRLFLFSLRHSDTEIRLMAKFDQPDRAAREWGSIRALRMLNVPAETILPLAKNEEADGVIVYPVAGDHRLKMFASLSDYLVKQLVSSPRNGIRCLDSCIDSLSFFYGIEPGAVDDRFLIGSPPYRWRQMFPDIPVESELRTHWERLGRQTSGLGDGQGIGSRDLPNPFSGLPQLDKATGHLRLSRIHGDLNFSNILVCPDLDQSPSKVYIVDLTDSKPGRATAIDLARIEVELWLDVYRKAAMETGLIPSRQLADMIAVYDVFENRHDLGMLSDAGQGVLKFLYRLRRRSAKILAPHHTERYMLHDYYWCLYYNYLMQFGYATRAIPADGDLVELAGTGASLTLRFLRDWERGLYSEVGPLHRASPCRRIEDLE